MHDKIMPSSDTFKMKQELLKLMPIGSDIQRAKEILTKNGFQTVYKTQTDFMETNREQKIEKFHAAIDFVYADLEKSAGFFSGISERWQIAVKHQGNQVEDIFISYGKTGP